MKPKGEPYDNLEIRKDVIDGIKELRPKATKIVTPKTPEPVHLTEEQLEDIFEMGEVLINPDDPRYANAWN